MPAAISFQIIVITKFLFQSTDAGREGLPSKFSRGRAKGLLEVDSCPRKDAVDYDAAFLIEEQTSNLGPTNMNAEEIGKNQDEHEIRLNTRDKYERYCPAMFTREIHRLTTATRKSDDIMNNKDFVLSWSPHGNLLALASNWRDPIASVSVFDVDSKIKPSQWKTVWTQPVCGQHVLWSGTELIVGCTAENPSAGDMDLFGLSAEDVVWRYQLFQFKEGEGLPEEPMSTLIHPYRSNQSQPNVTESASISTLRVAALITENNEIAVVQPPRFKTDTLMTMKSTAKSDKTDPTDPSQWSELALIRPSNFGPFGSWSETFSCLAWSPDAVQLIVGTHSGTLLLYQYTPQDQRLTLVESKPKAHSHLVAQAAWNPDKLATSDGNLMIWRQRTGGRLLEDGVSLKIENAAVVDQFAFSPDGMYLAVVLLGYMDLRLWYISPYQHSAWRQLQTLEHEHIILSIAWAPCGTKLASISPSNTAENLQHGYDIAGTTTNTVHVWYIGYVAEENWGQQRIKISASGLEGLHFDHHNMRDDKHEIIITTKRCLKPDGKCRTAKDIVEMESSVVGSAGMNILTELHKHRSESASLDDLLSTIKVTLPSNLWTTMWSHDNSLLAGVQADGYMGIWFWDREMLKTDSSMRMSLRYKIQGTCSNKDSYQGPFERCLSMKHRRQAKPLLVWNPPNWNAKNTSRYLLIASPNSGGIDVIFEDTHSKTWSPTTCTHVKINNMNHPRTIGNKASAHRWRAGTTSPDGRWFAVIQQKISVHIFKLSDHPRMICEKIHDLAAGLGGDFENILWSPQGDKLAISDTDGNLHVWDVEDSDASNWRKVHVLEAKLHSQLLSKRTLRTVQIHGNKYGRTVQSIASMAWDPSGNRLAVLAGRVGQMEHEAAVWFLPGKDTHQWLRLKGFLIVSNECSSYAVPQNGWGAIAFSTTTMLVTLPFCQELHIIDMYVSSSPLLLSFMAMFGVYQDLHSVQELLARHKADAVHRRTLSVHTDPDACLGCGPSLEFINCIRPSMPPVNRLELYLAGASLGKLVALFNLESIKIEGGQDSWDASRDLLGIFAASPRIKSIEMANDFLTGTLETVAPPPSLELANFSGTEIFGSLHPDWFKIQILDIRAVQRILDLPEIVTKERDCKNTVCLIINASTTNNHTGKMLHLYKTKSTVFADLCPPGFFLTDAVAQERKHGEPHECAPCPRGKYENRWGALVRTRACSSCPGMRTTLSTGTQFLQHCVCESGHYENEDGSCLRCDTIPGIACPIPNATMGNDRLQILLNFWRPANSSHKPLQCFTLGACNTEQDMDLMEQSCRKGHEQLGPFCEVCEPGWFKVGRGGLCQKCRDTVRLGVFEVVIFSILAIPVAVLIGCAVNKDFRRKVKASVKDFVRTQFPFILEKVKITYYSFQKFTSIRQLQPPISPNVEAVEETMSAATLTWVTPTHAATCWMHTDYFGRYSLVLGLMGVIVTVSLLAKKIKGDWLSVFILLWTLTIMEVTSSTASLFICDRRLLDINGHAYLMSDYSIECYENRHVSWMAVGITVFLIWCCAVPCLSLFKMWQQRSKLNPQLIFTDLDSTESHSSSLKLFASRIEAYSFFEKEFEKARAQVFSSNAIFREQFGCDSTGTVPREVAERIVPMPAQEMYNDLLKEGIRASFMDKELERYHHLWDKYLPSMWWFGILDVSGRMGYGILVFFPRSSQCKAGALLSTIILMLCVYLRPYKRSIENWMLVGTNAAVLFFFIIQDGVETIAGASGDRWPVIMDVLILLCCAFPCVLFVLALLSAYVFPSRHTIWAEKACIDEFVHGLSESLRDQMPEHIPEATEGAACNEIIQNEESKGSSSSGSEYHNVSTSPAQ